MKQRPMTCAGLNTRRSRCEPGPETVSQGLRGFKCFLTIASVRLMLTLMLQRRPRRFLDASAFVLCAKRNVCNSHPRARKAHEKIDAYVKHHRFQVPSGRCASPDSARTELQPQFCTARTVLQPQFCTARTVLWPQLCQEWFCGLSSVRMVLRPQFCTARTALQPRRGTAPRDPTRSYASEETYFAIPAVPLHRISNANIGESEAQTGG